jgi:signal transduction histidine kinase
MAPAELEARTPTPDPAVAVESVLEVRQLLNGVIRVCDVVFGTTTILLAGFATWLWLAAAAHALTVVTLWLMPVFNVAWSVVTRRRDRVNVDLVRGLICLPITTFLYVAEDGVLNRLWIPALIMIVGIGLTVGVASRSAVLSCAVTLGYAGALFVAAAVRFGITDFATVNDVFAILLTGCVIAVVANQLGRMVAEARRQRDAAREQQDRAESVLVQLTQRSGELTTAIDSLHSEIETRTRFEVELRHAQKLESVGRLAAGVAHEINTPVQFVSDSVQFVRAGVTELFGVVTKLEAIERAVLAGGPPLALAAQAAEAAVDAELPYLLEHIPIALDRALDGLDRVTRIVRSMKEFAHPDSKIMTVADLNHAVESTLTIARNEYKYVADLETELGDLPPVRCYLGELNQAVLNIVVNAAHAISDVVAGTDRKGRICVQTRRDGDDVVIAISDTGGGIPEAARDHIFDPFFTTKEVGKGTGQGLAIAHSVVVDKHHGQLGFQTELGKGTTFVIRLPIDQPAPHSGGAVARGQAPIVDGGRRAAGSSAA